MRIGRLSWRIQKGTPRPGRRRRGKVGRRVLKRSSSRVVVRGDGWRRGLVELRSRRRDRRVRVGHALVGTQSLVDGGERLPHGSGLLFLLVARGAARVGRGDEAGQAGGGMTNIWRRRRRIGVWRRRANHGGDGVFSQNVLVVVHLSNRGQEAAATGEVRCESSGVQTKDE